jgi:hypothetical protein
MGQARGDGGSGQGGKSNGVPPQGPTTAEEVKNMSEQYEHTHKRHNHCTNTDST